MPPMSNGERPASRGSNSSLTVRTRFQMSSALPCRRQAWVSPMPEMPSSVWTRTISVSIVSRPAPCEILNGWAKGRRRGMVSISVIFTRLLLQLGQEVFQHGRPLRPLRAARRVAELGVDLEVLRLDAGPLELVHHGRRDRRREELVGPREHVEYPGANPAEVALGVVLDGRLAQRDHRVGIELTGPRLGELPEARRAHGGIGDGPRERL